MQRSDGRAPDQIRPINFELNIAPHASGSVLVAMGNTRVICGVTIEEIVPRWMKDQGVTGGWLTAEYSMLPYSTTTRKQRDIAKGRLDGRSSEIQRLIGRSLRERDRSGEAWPPHDVDRLRCLASRRRHAHRCDHGREFGGDGCLQKAAGRKEDCVLADAQADCGSKRRHR